MSRYILKHASFVEVYRKNELRIASNIIVIQLSASEGVLKENHAHGVSFLQLEMVLSAARISLSTLL